MSELGNREIETTHNSSSQFLFLFILFDLAVLLAAVKIAVNSLASVTKGSITFVCEFFVSGKISAGKLIRLPLLRQCLFWK